MKQLAKVGLVAGCVMTLGVMAADVVWTGTGSWLDPTAWPGGALPASSNSVDIVAGSAVTFAGTDDATNVVGAVNVASTDDPALATLNITAGNFNPARFHVASMSTAVGKTLQSGGNVTINSNSADPRFAVGSAAGGTGSYELSGGSLSVTGNSDIGFWGDGSLLQTGGALAGSGWFVLGYGEGSSGRYEVSAGTAQFGAGLIVGERGTGHAVVRDDAAMTMNRLGINGCSELELLPGATLTFAYAEKQTNGQGTDGRFTLDGGTIVYRGDNAVQNNFINGTLDHVYVKDRGVTVSVPAGKLVTSQKPFEAHPDATAGDVTKAGDGILRLQGANTFKGKLKVQEGMVVLANENALDSYGSDKLEIAAGASVAVGTVLPAADRATVAARVAATSNAGYGVDTAGGDLTIADAITLDGTGGFSKFGANTLTLTGANSWSGETRIYEGTLAAQRGVGLPAASPLCFMGSSLWAPLADVAVTFGTGAGQLYASQDATRWGFATTTDDVTVSMASPYTTGAGSAKLATFALDAAADTKLTFAGDINLGINTTFEVPGAGTAAITGKVAPQGAARTFTKTGNGTLVLKGNLEATSINETTSVRNSFNVNAGALDIQSPSAAVGAVATANGGTLYLTNNTALTVSGLFHTGTAGNGRVVQENGEFSIPVNAGENLIGSAAKTHGVYEMRGGVINSAGTWQIGHAAEGEFLQTGGTVAINNWVGIARTGNGTGVLDVSGGTFSQVNPGTSISICHDGPGDGTLIVRDEGKVSTTAVGLAFGYGATGSAKVFVKDGGCLEAGYFVISNKKGALGERKISFDGGTLIAKRNQNCFMTLEPVIDVGAGGITFDSSTFTAGFAAQDFSPVGDSMTITKKGAGTMVLAGGVPEAAELRVDAGTVSLPLANKDRGLLHRWSFNGNLDDSVGGATAALVGSNNSFVDNQLHVGAGTWNTGGVNLGANMLPDDRPVTLEIWGTLNNSSSWNMLLDFGDSNNSHFAIVWRDSSATGNLSVILNGGGTTVATYGTATSEYLEKPVHGTKYHFAFKFIPDGLGGTRVFARQTEAATGKVVAMWQRQVANWTLAKVAQSHCWVGGPSTHHNNNGDANYDEVRIWGRALTPAELDASVAAGPDTIPDFYFLDESKSASSLVVAEDAVVDLAGGEAEIDNVAGSGAVSNGTLTVTGVLSPGAGAVGTLHVDGDLVVKGTLRLDCGDRIECTGDLDLTNAQVEIANRQNWVGNASYTFATVGGSIRRSGRIPCNLSNKGYVVCVGEHSAYIYVGGTVIFVR